MLRKTRPRGVSESDLKKLFGFVFHFQTGISKRFFATMQRDDLILVADRGHLTMIPRGLDGRPEVIRKETLDKTADLVSKASETVVGTSVAFFAGPAAAGTATDITFGTLAKFGGEVLLDYGAKQLHKKADKSTNKWRHVGAALADLAKLYVGLDPSSATSRIAKLSEATGMGLENLTSHAENNKGKEKQQLLWTVLQAMGSLPDIKSH